MDRTAMTAASRSRRLPALLRLLRPHQWVKNLLLFVPILLSHQPRDLAYVDRVIVAFAAFCLVASFGYILNDLRDLSADRASLLKRHRPLASGEVQPAAALPIAAALLAAAIVLSLLFHLSREFLFLLFTYAVATLLYSFWLKHRFLIDVIFLAALYALRLLAGCAAVEVQITPWLLAFSVFFFLSLAFAKRYVELSTADSGQMIRQYVPQDMDIIRSVGPASGYMAVLVMANYINSEVAKEHYRHPALLWAVWPILLYWITRVWFFARRGELHEDPIIFALKDHVSWIAGLLVCALIVTAIALN